MRYIRAHIAWLRERSEYIVLFFLCLFSRLLTASYHVRDPYGLKYALGIKGEEVSGTENPLFTYTGRLLYEVSGECALSCSMIGGMGIFLIIIFSLAITNTPICSLEGGVITVLIFFNPFLWVMSNAFLPDLFELALLVAALYYLLFDPFPWRQAAGLLIAGMVAGTGDYQFAFIALPVMYVFWAGGVGRERFIGLLSGVLLWGFSGMMIGEGSLDPAGFSWAAGEGTGEQGIANRAFNYLYVLWTKGLGGFDYRRSWETLIISAVILVAFLPGAMVWIRESKHQANTRLLLVSSLTYLVCVAGFTPGYGDYRYILPLLPVVLILVAYGIIYLLIHWNNLWTKTAFLAFMVAYTMLAVRLVVAHREPSAFNKIKEYVVRQKEKDLMIIAPGAVNFYLAGSGLKARYYTPDNFRKEANRDYEGKVLFIGPKGIRFPGTKIDTCFRHNPFLKHRHHELVVYKR